MLGVEAASFGGFRWLRFITASALFSARTGQNLLILREWSCLDAEPAVPCNLSSIWCVYNVDEGSFSLVEREQPL